MTEQLPQVSAPKPVVVKDPDGKERTSTGRWSLAAIAEWVGAHPETMFTAPVLARIGYATAYAKNVEAARKNIRLLANALEERGVAVVVEFSGRRLWGIQVYNRDNEYHQKLMADEIARRELRADGSAEKLHALIRFLPSVAA